MNAVDYIVLVGALLGIAAYGMWRTRGKQSLNTYLRGDGAAGWAGIGLSVMATQASAITFMSTPGQGYANGLGFVQNYFGLPLALIVVSAVFLPLFRKWNVYTAYEFLGRRFDKKTRLLGAGLFLLQRGLAAGITIYAPAIVLSAIFGWRLDLTILCSGCLVIAYTAIGGSDAVTITQKYQMGLIFAGMAGAFVVVFRRLHSQAAVSDIVAVAGSMGRLKAVDFSTDMNRRYTFWSGLLGGFFLSLSYFGTDQSQVQRYLSGSSLRESRLGLMFNAVAKIPMQFFILLLGVLVFVFYELNPAPVLFNHAEWARESQGPAGAPLRAAEAEYQLAHQKEMDSLKGWHVAGALGTSLPVGALYWHRRAQEARARAQEGLKTVDPHAPNDNDYVFIRFVVDQLPHGLLGLLIAVFFAAALSSKAGELNALASTTLVDLYRPLVKKAASDVHYVGATRLFTVFWGCAALAFALWARLAENLIQAINILGSLFYGVTLALFLVAFFLRRVGGTAVFAAALTAQILVFVLFWKLNISYLWYNLIGCSACVFFSLVAQAALPRPAA